MSQDRRIAQKTRYRPVFPDQILDVDKYLIREITINDDELKDTSRAINDVLLLLARIQKIIKPGLLWSERDPTPGFALPLFGPGSDGDVTITGTIDLNRDMYYNNLIVESGGVINTRGFRVFVRNKLTLHGNINNNGNDISKVLGAGASGGTAGISGIGDNGDNVSNTLELAGSGSEGGDGGDSVSADAGGSGGTVASSINPGRANDVVTLVRGFVAEGKINGGAGGGGGAGDSASAGNTGGEGGSGGGVVMVTAREIEINTDTGPGTITANGGDGENSVDPEAGGGGGGGGGVAMVLSARVYDIDTESTTDNSSASYILSEGGSGGSGSDNGDDGNDGTVIEVII